jgi:hypothetical protein
MSYANKYCKLFTYTVLIQVTRLRRRSASRKGWVYFFSRRSIFVFICVSNIFWLNQIVRNWKIIEIIFLISIIVILFSGWTIPVNNFSMNDILPSTESFLTYEGSLTRPGCMETVTWIILNRPIHISYRQVGNIYVI